MDLGMKTTPTIEKPKFPVEFTRYQWANPVDRAWWNPLIIEASNAFQELEKQSVLLGWRKAAWLFFNPDKLIDFQLWAHQHDLIVIPTEYKTMQSGYSSSSDPLPTGLSTGQPRVRVILTR